MKKILHFHPNAFYAQKFVGPLNFYESKRGFLSKIVTEINNAPSDYYINFTITLNPLKLFLRILNLLIFLNKYKPNIIVVHNSSSALIPLFVSRLLSIKNIIYFNHGLPYLGYKGAVKILLVSLEKLNCLLAKKIITVSNDMKINFKSITKKKVFVIHNGTASGLDLKYKKHNLNIVKKIIDFKKGDRVIIFVGRANKRKGFYDVMNIWSKFFKDKDNFKLILIGINQKDVMEKLKNKAKNIFPIGLVNDPAPYFKLADYLFMTSHHEGLSYTVLECFKYRTIVISNKIKGVSELVNHKINGFLVKDNEISLYSDYVNYCEKNKKIKKIFLERSYNILSKYNREEFLLHYLAFLKK